MCFFGLLKKECAKNLYLLYYLCQSLFLILFQAEAVFSCEFCEILMNTFVTVHLRATASDDVKSLTKKQMTGLINVLLGCISCMLNVCFNKLFKAAAKKQFEDHLDKDLQKYTDAKSNQKEES